MKKYIARIVVMLLIASVLPLQVSAAEKESIELAVEAEQVGVCVIDIAAVCQWKHIVTSSRLEGRFECAGRDDSNISVF